MHARHPAGDRGAGDSGLTLQFGASLVFVTVLRDDAFIGSDRRKVSSWHTVACEKFWPDGGGRFNLS